MNKVILIGNLTRDPELEETRSGISYAKLSIAVNRNYTTEDGDRITDFFDFTVWRERAENCCRYLKKGSKVAVIGSIENRTWEDDDGNKRKVTEVKCSEIEFLSSKRDEDSDEPPKRSNKKPRLEEVDDDDDDLPF